MIGDCKRTSWRSAANAADGGQVAMTIVGAFGSGNGGLDRADDERRSDHQRHDIANRVYSRMHRPLIGVGVSLERFNDAFVDEKQATRAMLHARDLDLRSAIPQSRGIDSRSLARHVKVREEPDTRKRQFGQSRTCIRFAQNRLRRSIACEEEIHHLRDQRHILGRRGRRIERLGPRNHLVSGFNDLLVVGATEVDVRRHRAAQPVDQLFVHVLVVIRNVQAYDRLSANLLVELLLQQSSCAGGSCYIRRGLSRRERVNHRTAPGEVPRNPKRPCHAQRALDDRCTRR